MAREANIPEVAKNALKMEYEPEVDILTVYIQSPETLLGHSAEVKSGVILNYAEDGSLSSVEVLDAARRYPAGQLAACSVDELIDLKTASGWPVCTGKSPHTGAEGKAMGDEVVWAVGDHP